MNNTSLGEQKIIEILNKEHIAFVREKSFEEAIRIPKCRFDFYLPKKNILIEFQGKQHYQLIPHFFKDRSSFLKSQERDRLKISAALAMKIPLYCIPYWDIDTIKNFEDLIKPEYLAKSKFHNDDSYRKHQNLR